MIEGSAFFHYRTGNTFMHRLPAWLKVLLIPVLAIIAFNLPVRTALIAWGVVLIFALFLRFSPKEIANDMKPTFLYLVILYNTSFVFNYTLWKEGSGGNVITFDEFVALFKFADEYALLFVRMGLSLSITAIIYRTTSNMQFRQGFASIERILTKKDEAPFSDMLGLTLTFIPRIVSYWQRIDTAWTARAGKSNARKLLTLVPRLFSVSLPMKRPVRLKTAAPDVR